MTITSAAEFLELAKQSEGTVSEEIRWGEASQEVWLEVIALDPELKTVVLINKRLPFGVLEVLSHDADRRVRYTVATKRKMPLHVMETLSRDSDVLVRSAIAWNGSATRQVLEQMAFDPEKEIAEKARQRLNDGEFR